MSPLLAMQLALLLIIVIALLMLMSSIAGSVGRWFSGEPTSLMVRGFMPVGLRLRRTVELQTVVSRLAVITRLNLPLNSALSVAAAGENRRIRRTLEDMGKLIRDGAPVSTALAAAFCDCPPQLIEILRNAESCGQLSAALADQERTLDRLIDMQSTTTPHARHAISYLAFMLLFAATVVSWFMIMVMPKFEDIFLDFGVRLPSITLKLAAVSNWLVRHLWVLLVIIGAITALCFANLLFARKSGERGLVSRLVANARRAIPGTRSMDYGLGMAQAIRAMMLGIRSGAADAFSGSLPSVVSPTNYLRHRLAKFAQAIDHGVAPHQAAADAELGSVFVSALRMVERGQDAERVLGYAAEYYDAIACRWWHALSAMSGPVVTLVLGLLVAFIALAIFTPLIALINAVAESI